MASDSVKTDVSDTPRLVAHCPGEGKRKLDAKDLLDLFTYLDK